MIVAAEPLTAARDYPASAHSNSRIGSDQDLTIRKLPHNIGYFSALSQPHPAKRRPWIIEQPPTDQTCPNRRQAVEGSVLSRTNRPITLRLAMAIGLAIGLLMAVLSWAGNVTFPRICGHKKCP